MNLEEFSMGCTAEGVGRGQLLCAWAFDRGLEWGRALRHHDKMANAFGWAFIGPCAHGRDPYTRCDGDVPGENCEALGDVGAAVLAEREACAELAEAEADGERSDPAYNAAMRIFDAIRARGGK